MKRKRIVKDMFVNLRWLSKRAILFLIIIMFLTFNITIFSESEIHDNLYQNSGLGVSRTNCLNEFDSFYLGLLAHYIKSGETLYRLSRIYFVSIEKLIAINKISDPRQLKIGQKILIPEVDREIPLIQKIQVNSSKTVMGLIKKFQLEMWQFKRLNPTLNIEEVKKPTVIYMPCYIPATKPQLFHTHDTINLIKPVRGFISSRFGYRWGRMHYGLDLAALIGAEVKAAASGKVIFTGWNGGYGLLIKINHGNFKTFYGHLSSILVKEGSPVKQGQVIGLVGATGKAYGSHLHFEVESYGKKVNPATYISAIK